MERTTRCGRRWPWPASTYAHDCTLGGEHDGPHVCACGAVMPRYADDVDRALGEVGAVKLDGLEP